jgi:fatty-acyl-CoA synthase
LTFVGPSNLAELLTEAEHQRPSGEAIVTPDRRLTYRELKEEADLLSGGLISMGVQPGDAVAMVMPSVAESYVAFFAVTQIGAIFSPLHTKWKPRELEYGLRRSKAKVLLVASPGSGTDYWAKLDEVLPGLGDRQQFAELPHLRHVVACDGTRRVEHSYEDLLRLGGVRRVADQVRGASSALKDLDPAILQFTSGSTAFPKGALLAHLPTVRMGVQLSRNFAITQDDRFFTCSPITHLGGTTFSLVTAIAGRATFLTIPQFNARTALEWMVAEQCSMEHGIDTHWLLQMQEAASLEKLPSFRLISVGAIPPLLETVYEMFKPEFIVAGWGTTETGGAPVKSTVFDPLEKCLHTNGKPLPGIELSIVDPETGQDCEAGQEGEIRVKGWSQFLGYLDQPEETAAQWDELGRTKSGDLGAVDDDGYLHFFGRLKRMFRTGGENYAPDEVEAVLQSHPAVSVAVVVPVQDAVAVQVGHAYIVASAGTPPSISELQAFCLERLASFKVPRSFEFIAEADLPTTESGKVQRIAMADGRAQQETPAAAET